MTPSDSLKLSSSNMTGTTVETKVSNKFLRRVGKCSTSLGGGIEDSKSPKRFTIRTP